LVNTIPVVTEICRANEMSLLDLKQSITSGPANGGNGGKRDHQKQFFRATITAPFS